MERQIQVRDPSSSPERQDASQRSMGRAGDPEGFGMVRHLETRGEERGVIMNAQEYGVLAGSPDVPDLSGCAGVFFDAGGSNADNSDASISYDRLDEIEPLGISSSQGEDTVSLRIRACFNCSSQDHVLSACLEPRDPQRIAAARIAYEESGIDSSGDGDGEEHPNFGRRYFSAPLWRKQRLEWVDKFQPGRVVGAELREAVGLPRDVPLDPDSEFQDCVPWFDGGRAEGSCGGMMFWGYPPGWVGPSDPRELMRNRIKYAHNWEDALEELVTFGIYEGEGQDQIVELATTRPRPPAPIEDHPPDHRWAHYQTTLFSSDKLTISNVDCPLPPVPKGPDTSISTDSTKVDRKALWAKLVSSQNPSQPAPSAKPLPPWRTPYAFNWGVPY